MHPETLAARAGTEPDPATGAVSPPIHLSTTFERDPDGSYPKGYVYAREDNPTRRRFEEALARLEGGAACAAFASGMAAASAVFASLAPGDRVVIPEDVYHGVRRVLRTRFEAWGLRVSEADLSRPGSLHDVVTDGTRLVWIETPSNPLLRITDIRAVADRAHEVGALCVVDGTWTTPLLQRPLELGADLVVHSVTKYIGGHSDVLGGAVVGPDSEAFAAVRTVQRSEGAVMDPFSAWLALRGLRSLGARLDRQCDTAARVAATLAAHPAVAAVHFPGLPADPGHAVASRQMSRPGAMLSFRVKGGEAAALRVAARVRLFTRATSLGGTESLIEHRASVEGEATRTPRDLLRVSVGLEHPDDLVEDLVSALEAPRDV
jgi:cystathionine gamma-synthase